MLPSDGELDRPAGRFARATVVVTVLGKLNPTGLAVFILWTIFSDKDSPNVLSSVSGLAFNPLGMRTLDA